MNLDLFPEEPGVYLMKNRQDQVIYVGKANLLKQRLKQYFSGQDSRPIIPFLIKEIAHIDTIVVDNEKEALLLENTLIKKHRPKYNALLKDDKSFICLMLDKKKKWPMIRLVRHKGEPKEEGLFFGPYTNAKAARQTFELICRLFPLRQCSDAELRRRTRPCLLYGMKRCLAPCVNLCTAQEYHLFVESAENFLKGHDKEVLKQLHADMQQASEQMEYEQAEAILRTIKQVEHVTKVRQLVARTGGKDSDCLALYRHGNTAVVMQLFIREGHLVGAEHEIFPHAAQDDQELLASFILQYYQNKKQLPRELLLPFPLDHGSILAELLSLPLVCPQKGEKKALVALAQKNAKAAYEQEKTEEERHETLLLDLVDKLHLNRYPKRIDCFDTSNISGSDLVASMAVFTDGVKDAKRSRLYKIRDIPKGDDYAALRQVLTRRLARAKEEDDLPDLIIVDGGKAQLSVAVSVLKELDIASVDAIAITKEMAKHTKGLTAERLFVAGKEEPIALPSTSALLFFLQNIRDEAHRRAIGFHRKRREKRLLGSALTDIPGIGKTKKTLLLRHFGSPKRLQQATPEQLAQVKGLTKKDRAALQEWQNEVTF
jgi:excinuclease ABC subunit C